jgi:hypothetical protein
MANQTGTVTLKLTNRLSRTCKVVLEPWTGEYSLKPGATFDIVAEGDLGLPLELEISAERLTIYSFDSEGALLTIIQNGEELRSE